MTHIQHFLQMVVTKSRAFVTRESGPGLGESCGPDRDFTGASPGHCPVQGDALSAVSVAGPVNSHSLVDH